MNETKNACKRCGSPMGPENICRHCTVTDLDISEILAAHAAAAPVPEVKQAPVYLWETHTHSQFPIISNSCKIGRSPDNDICLAGDGYASRFHALITCEDGHYFVQDVGSTNGTFLNDTALVSRRPLVNGDRVRVGRSEFTFVLDPSVDPANR